MQHFTQLEVWERSHQRVLEIYKISARFPNIAEASLAETEYLLLLSRSWLSRSRSA